MFLNSCFGVFLSVLCFSYLTESCVFVSCDILAWWRPFGSDGPVIQSDTHSASLWTDTAYLCLASNLPTYRSTAQAVLSFCTFYTSTLPIVLMSFTVIISHCEKYFSRKISLAKYKQMTFFPIFLLERCCHSIRKSFSWRPVLPFWFLAD